MIRKLKANEYKAAKELLAGYKLPTEDLNPEYVQLFGYFNEKDFIGCVGIEEFDDALLLRSLAVKNMKGTCGIGTMLTEYVGRYAFRNGKKPVYLLTDTADVFFSRLGYCKCKRTAAPENIQQTKQFAQLCAETANLMKLEF